MSLWLQPPWKLLTLSLTYDMTSSSNSGCMPLSDRSMLLNMNGLTVLSAIFSTLKSVPLTDNIATCLVKVWHHRSCEPQYFQLTSVSSPPHLMRLPLTTQAVQWTLQNPHQCYDAQQGQWGIHAHGPRSPDPRMMARNSLGCSYELHALPCIHGNRELL